MKTIMQRTERTFRTSEKRRAYAVNYRANRTEAQRQSDAAYHCQYRANHKAELTEKARKYQRDNALYIQLRRKGLTIEDYNRVVAQHRGVCDICGGPPDGRWDTFTLDHCHNTGELRGILCSKCNRGIGFFQDDTQLLIKAVNYLKRKPNSGNPQ